MYQFKKTITIGECLLLHESGFAIPCRNGRPIGAIDEYGGDVCVCCGATVPEGRMICLFCEKGKEMKSLKKKKLAYVAGPYRAKTKIGVLANILRARKVARQLWKQGYAVICPHSNSAFMSGKDIAEFHFLQGYCTILEKCDVAVFLPGWEKSEGSKEEMQVAYNNKLEIFEWNSLVDRPVLMTSHEINCYRTYDERDN